MNNLTKNKVIVYCTINNINKYIYVGVHLCRNLKYNIYSGLHPEGCTFCIESKLLKDKCEHCFWSINHGKCKSLKGTFQTVQEIIKDNQYELITPQEYGDLVKKVIQKEKKMLVDK